MLPTLTPDNVKLDDDGREFSTLLWERARSTDAPPAGSPLPDAAWLAALHYLTVKVEHRGVTPSEIGHSYSVSGPDVSRAAMRVRVAGRYRELLVALERERLGLEEPEPTPEGPEPPAAGEPEGPAEEKQEPEPTFDDEDRTTLRSEVDDHRFSTMWRFEGELFEWQRACIEKWWANNARGIAKVVTGAGKTLLALYLTAELNSLERYKNGNLLTLIIVPTMALLNQWRTEVEEHLGIPTGRIGVYHGGRQDHLRDHEIVIITSHSARNLLPESSLDRDTFLIADECHRLGAPATSRVFDQSYDYTIGLSATPERRSDFGFEEILVPNLGPIIYNYSYADAVRDEILSPFDLEKYTATLLRREKLKYEELSETIRKLTEVLRSRYPSLRTASSNNFFQIMGSLKKRYEDEDIEKFTVLTTRRKEILHRAENKFRCLQHVLGDPRQTGRRILIFHERIDHANRINRALRDEGYASAAYHSELPTQRRQLNLERFRTGECEALVTCRALDEGLDIPAIDLAVIVAATTSVRQYIQRFGRVLRRSGDKDVARIVTINVEAYEDDIFEQEELQDLEEAARDVRSYRFPTTARGVVEAAARALRRFIPSRPSGSRDGNKLHKRPAVNGHTPDGPPLYRDSFDQEQDTGPPGPH